MKRGMLLLAACLMLALSACGEEPGEAASAPLEPSLGQSLPLESSPGASTPPEAPTPEELLARQPIDDTHDAFLVETGGKLGTLLATAEKGERGSEPNPEWELWEFPVHFFVWNPRDMDEPIQTMAVLVDDLAFGHHEVVDANFDGYMDFSCLYLMGNGASSSFLWVWDEGIEQFVEVPEYREISFPRCNPETEVIDGFARSSGAGDGVTTFHRWEDGELVCIRRIELWWDPDEEIMTEEETTVHPMHITVEDRIDRELTQVYSTILDPGEDYLLERAKWENLDYHGE